MTEAKLSPAARIVVNPWDAERVRLQEAVIEAALQWFAVESLFYPVNRKRVAMRQGLFAAVLALRDYTAPKHHAAKTRRAAK